MSLKYNPREIEEKWRGEWERAKAFTVTDDESKEKFYLLEMFPYPSGRIHMGHVRNYSIGDVLARFYRMRGYNLLHPMGWDAFGLPAENAAIQNNIHPAAWTYDNIDNMKSQLKRLGFSYDWDREIATCDPAYYRWNQWFFLKMYEKGLAYKKRSSVNWCPRCVTVLANEQVDDGRCWRCESEVETRELEQWFLRITDYAEELLAGCDTLSEWPDRVLTMQRHWIGKSIGAEVHFQVVDSEEVITVFTTRPDTLYGATFMSLAPEHPMVEGLIRGRGEEGEVRNFIETVMREERRLGAEGVQEKRGVFTGASCINPVTGEHIPIYVANFVLMEYGTGAVMAVPTHDQRDFEFAGEYGLPLRVVINPPGEELDPATMEAAYEDDGIMVNSGPFDGMGNREAIESIVSHLEEKGLGKRMVTYRLRDWGISRQRYWGCPIPVIYCEKCGIVPAPYEELPVILPEDITFTEGGISPLKGSGGFEEATCPTCGGRARRETDTMDTFVDSSWYFLRYVSPHEESLPFDRDSGSYWMPVDQYVGGIEHAVMHLLYARFFTKVLRDIGLIAVDEPFKRLLTQGMVCKEIARCPEDGYLSPDEVEEEKCLKCGVVVEIGAVEKMSKSKRNTIDPDRIIERYGADTTRLFTLFAAPPERDLEWSDEGVEGSYRFLWRVWRLVGDNIDDLKGVEAYDGSGELHGYLREMHGLTHRTIKKVTEDIQRRFHFNTAISAVMELVNALYQWKGEKNGMAAPVLRESVEAVILLLSPFAPHLCEELWERLGKHEPLYRSKWPSYREEALKVDEVLIVVQVNGKMRSRVGVPADAGEEEVKGVVLDDAKVGEWIGGKEIRKTIYVSKKLMNLVVG
ncbi:MAG: leucine--tRNA ligase [Thermodesulfobacteriota bacterium]